MKKVDYIIVGDGFASMFFAHQLLKNNKSFVVFSDGQQGASKISAGIVNPVVLKKFTTFSGALEQITSLTKVLDEMEIYLKQNSRVNEPVYRLFHDVKEKETWLKKAGNEDLIPFLDSEFSSFIGVENPFGAGKVKHSFRVNVPLFFSLMQSYLKNINSLIEEQFDYSKLNTEVKIYGDHSYSKIIFAEGIGVKNNPYFKTIPIVVNKGHHLTLKIDEYSLSETVKKKFFLFPLNENEYYYGGTYDRDNETSQIDARAKEQLISGLEEMISNSYSITEITYGFRPTVKDRKPILGSHPTEKDMFVFNGLGTRGLLNGAVYSEILFDYIETNSQLPEEVDIKRFS